MSKKQNIQATRRRRKKVLRLAKGYFGNSSRLYRYARHQVDHAGQNAYRDRRKKKTDMRQLWIVRLNAACRNLGIPYSRFICGLKKAGIEMDRRVLSNIAATDEAAFKAIVEKVRPFVPAN